MNLLFQDHAPKGVLQEPVRHLNRAVVLKPQLSVRAVAETHAEVDLTDYFHRDVVKITPTLFRCVDPIPTD